MIDELRLSVSKTKCFNQCRKQFEFSYILKLPKKTRDYHVLGSFCHLVLEEFHLAYCSRFSQQPFNIEMTAAFKKAMIEFKDKITPEIKKEAWDMISKYLTMISRDQRSGLVANVLEVEKKFNLTIENNVVLNGMIDRIQLDPDGVMHVADYKTTKNKKYLLNDWFQLLTYAFILLSEDPSLTKVRASYILLRHDFEYITTEFDVSQILKVKEQFLEYANAIRNETEYEPSTSMLCSYCDFLTHCPAGMEKAANAFNSTIHGEVSW